MNVIVTGASGLLGRAVVAEFKRNSWKVLGLAYRRARGDLVRVDLLDTNAVAAIVREFKPHAIIHCAAEKSPDMIQARPDKFEQLNVQVPEELAKLSAEVKAVFVFISSDYVFAGNYPPYSEDCKPDPVNAYGMLKVKAEENIIKINPGSCVLRIPVLYGGEETITESTISSLIRDIISHARRDVSNYEIRFPSHTSDIAKIIYELVQRKLNDPTLEHNIFHWNGKEPFTKYQMSRLIAATFGYPHDNIIPFMARSPFAPRPRNAHLSCERLESLGIQHHTKFEDGIEEFRRFFP